MVANADLAKWNIGTECIRAIVLSEGNKEIPDFQTMDIKVLGNWCDGRSLCGYIIEAIESSFVNTRRHEPEN